MSCATFTQFCCFLDDIGLFGEFWSEFYKIRGGRRMTLREYNYFSTIPPERFVSSAFPWNATTLGDMFWRRIHHRWLRCIGCKNQK